MNKMIRGMQFLIIPLALMSLNGCKETDPQKPAYWLQVLDDKRADTQEKNEALQKLGELHDVENLRKILTDRSQGAYRARAASALAATGDKSVAKDLVSMIDYSVGTGTDERSKNIRRSNEKIIEALGILKAPEGIEPGINLLEADDPIIRKAACRALGNIGDAKAVEALGKTALNDDNANICRTAVEALGNIGDKSAIPVLVKALFIERKTSLYPYASFALYQIGSDSIPALYDLLDGKNEEVNKLSQQLNFAPGVIEIKALEVLGDLRPADFEKRLLAMYNKYSKVSTATMQLQPLVMRSIVMAMEKNGSVESAKLLSDEIQDIEDFSVREFYANAINSISYRAVSDDLLSAANTGDADAKRVVIKAYTQLGTGNELKALDAFAKNGFKSNKGDLNAAVSRIVANERVRLVVAQECGKDLACWQNKLSDENPRVRNKAAFELGRLSEKDTVSADIIKALVKATADDDADVRRAAIWSLFKLQNPAGISEMEATLARDDGKPDYYRVNEELKRLIVFLKWQKK